MYQLKLTNFVRTKPKQRPEEKSNIYTMTMI